MLAGAREVSHYDVSIVGSDAAAGLITDMRGLDDAVGRNFYASQGDSREVTSLRELTEFLEHEGRILQRQQVRG